MGVGSKLMLLRNRCRGRWWFKKLLPIPKDKDKVRHCRSSGGGGNMTIEEEEEEEDERIISPPPIANSWSRLWRRWKRRRATLLFHFHDIVFHAIYFIEAFVLVGAICFFYCFCAGCHI